MTTPVLMAPVAPAISSTKNVKYRIKRSDFGDGYSQRSGDGLNGVVRTLNVAFENLTPEDAYTLETFFNGLGGFAPFYYTMPLESTQRLWITKDGLSISYPGPSSITISAVFEECFDIVGDLGGVDTPSGGDGTDTPPDTFPTDDLFLVASPSDFLLLDDGGFLIVV